MFLLFPGKHHFCSALAAEVHFIRGRMEKLVKLNRMRLEVLKKCLYRSHHLGNTVGVQTGL